MALSMISSLRMQAVSASLLGFPVADRRKQNGDEGIELVATSTIAADLTCGRMEDVDAFDLDLHLAAVGWQHVNIGLAKDDEEVAFASVLEIVGHMQVGVHACLEHGKSGPSACQDRAGLHCAAGRPCRSRQECHSDRPP